MGSGMGFTEPSKGLGRVVQKGVAFVGGGEQASSREALDYYTGQQRAGKLDIDSQRAYVELLLGGAGTPKGITSEQQRHLEELRRKLGR